MIGKNLYIIPQIEKIDECVLLAKKYNLHFEYNDFFLPNVFDNEKVTDERIAFYKAVSGLPVNNTLHGAFLDVTVFSSDDKIREISEGRIRKSMEIAKRLDAGAVIIHTNFIPNFRDDNYEACWIDRNADFIIKLMEEFPTVRVYMENMFDMNPELLANLAVRLEKYENFGVCLDYAHACVFGRGLRPSDWIEKLGKHIRHIHINDNDFEKDAHMALGQGKIDFDEFFALYEKYCPEASVLIEVSGIDNIEQSLDFLKRRNLLI